MLGAITGRTCVRDRRLVLLAGWGFGCAPLQPLADALGSEVRVDIEALPALDHASTNRWLDALDERLPRDAWLGGWSLGGMLAGLLAARRGAACPGLLTLASNASFTACEGWPTAMPVATLKAFHGSYEQNPATTLKRFAMLCSQGAVDARVLSRALMTTADGADSLAGLDLLATLDTRSALQRFNAPQLHVFADADALVPISASAAVQAVQPDAEVHLMKGASHAFVFEQADDVAAVLARFMRAQA